MRSGDAMQLATKGFPPKSRTSPGEQNSMGASEAFVDQHVPCLRASSFSSSSPLRVDSALDFKGRGQLDVAYRRRITLHSHGNDLDLSAFDEGEGE